MNESSRSTVTQLFEDLAGIGQSVMDDIENVRLSTLIAFEQYLSQANLMKTRVERICNDGVLGRFTVTDLNGVDLANTTASLRPDIGAVTLRERGTFVASPVKEIRFSADKGTYQKLANTYKVMSTAGIPTGTFEVEYISPIMGNLVVFDIVTASADLRVTVSAIGPDLTEFSADRVSRNGYRVSAWLPQKQVKYLRIALTPTNPDVAGGLGYTFGITDLNSSSLTYHLASDLVMKPITITPRAPGAVFRAPTDSGISYFMSFDGSNFTEVVPGQEIILPGYSTVIASGLALNVAGEIQGVDLPPGLIHRSLEVADDDGIQLPVVFNLKAGQIPASQCVVVIGSALSLKPFTAEDAARLFSLSYQWGPATLNVWLKVKLSATSNIATPVFTGAFLEELL